jgi:hypothetical protein
MTLEEYFATGPPFERPVFDAVHRFLSTLGEVHVEPVSVGIFIKKKGSFVELRPKTKWVAMSFPLDRTVDRPPISRRPVPAGSRVYHYVNLRSPADLTTEVRDLLAESFDVTA